MSFNDLPLQPLIRRNLHAMGFREPRPVQAQAIPSIIEGRDVIGLAPTGTGKTVAFLAPILHHLLESPPPSDGRRRVDPTRRLRALALCPTRELAIQVEREAARLAAGTVLRTAVAYGKVGLRDQVAAIAKGIDLLVATPGRVRELLEAGALTLAHVRHVAIDEADRMMDMGFLPQVASILDVIPGDRQIVLFTATMPRDVEQLAGTFLNGPVRIEVGRHTTPAHHVEQHLAQVEQQDKVGLILHLLSERDLTGVLIFCRTRRRVGWVGTALQRHGIACGMIHGDRTQAQRLRALEQLQSGRVRVIVSSDVAARGLHIPAIHTVINYDVPPNAEEYVHRIGRAGHGGSQGEAWTLLSGVDRERWTAIRRQLDLRLTPHLPDGFEPTVTTEKPSSPTRGGHDRDSPSSDHSTQRGRTHARQRPTRSKKSRPIRKGQKPGGGVTRRPHRPDDA